ncbi:MAG: tetratricopeptide repeat protein, partial [Planctomycetota bacterium]
VLVPQFLEQVLSLQVKANPGQHEEQVIELFGWEEASFVFDDDPAPEGIFDAEQFECRIHIDPKTLSLGASLRKDAWRDIASRIGSEAEVFVVDPDTDTADLSHHAASLLPMLDGTRDLQAVIEAVPLTRFQALSAVADLIRAGVARHATAEQLRVLAQQAQDEGRINRSAELLGAALDRDADDLEIRWQRIALYEKAGRPTEAAQEYKLLAAAMEARGDVAGALAAFERASELAPYETDTLERIADIHDQRGEIEEYGKARCRLATALAARGRHEQALEVYQGLLGKQGALEDRSLRESMAATYLKLRQPRRAVRELLELGETALAEGGLDRALRYYRSASSIDEGCEQATTRIREIESGHLRTRRHRQRRIAVFVCATLCIGLLLVQLAREASAHEALHHAARATVSGLAQDPADRILVNAISQYSQIYHDHPLTLGARRAKEMIRALLLEELQQVEMLVDDSPAEAEKVLRLLGRVRYPGDLRELWHEARDDLLRRIAELRAASSGAKAR